LPTAYPDWPHHAASPLVNEALNQKGEVGGSGGLSSDHCVCRPRTIRNA